MDEYGYGAEPSEATINAWLEDTGGYSGLSDWEELDTGDGQSEGRWIDDEDLDRAEDF